MRLYRYDAGQGPRLGAGFGPWIHDIEALFAKAGYAAPGVVKQADMRTLAAAPNAVVVFLIEAFEEMQPADAPDGSAVLDPKAVRLLPPVANPGKIICVGHNYRAHVQEQNAEMPKAPVLFAKFSNTLRGHGDVIVKPLTTNRLDYEGELCVVVGAGGRRIAPEQALGQVFGYTIANDVSARDLQKADGQWVRAKSQDGFAPMGPCIVTSDEITDPGQLVIRTRVNGELVQDASTSQMIFSVRELVSIISQGITLDPGDLILTGTPSGVGMHRDPPLFLKEGDRVDIEIDRIGVLGNTITEEK